MLRPDDLRKPQVASGYKNVRSATAGPNGGGQTVLWKAHSKGVRVGPYRHTAREAAQDYCDYANGQEQTDFATLNYPSREQVKAEKDNKRDPEYENALGVIRDFKAQQEGKQGFVYLIGVKGDSYGVKVGYSVNPEKRVIELQTGNPRELVLLGKIKGTSATEKALHASFLRNNLVGEWFTPTPELLSEFGVKQNQITGTKVPKSAEIVKA